MNRCVCLCVRMLVCTVQGCVLSVGYVCVCVGVWCCQLRWCLSSLCVYPGNHLKSNDTRSIALMGSKQLPLSKLWFFCFLWKWTMGINVSDSGWEAWAMGFLIILLKCLLCDERDALYSILKCHCNFAFDWHLISYTKSFSGHLLFEFLFEADKTLSYRTSVIFTELACYQ